MQKQELAELIYLKKEVVRQKARLAGLNAALTNCTSKLTGLPDGGGPQDKIGYLLGEMEQLKTEMEQSVERCWQRVLYLEQYINTVKNSEMREILRLRYLEGKSWQQIAFAVGYYDESVPRKQHDRFLRQSLEQSAAKTEKKEFGPEA